MKTQGIKEEGHSNSYDSVYKLIRQLFNFCQAEDESSEKLLKRFLYLSSPLNISGIGVKTHSHQIDMECKKLIKADPNKSKASAKKKDD